MSRAWKTQEGATSQETQAAASRAGRGEKTDPPRSLRMEHSPADTLILTQGDLVNLDLQNCMVMNVRCFKPLNQLPFVTAAIEN